MRNLINVRCWSRLTYLNILSYRNLWDTRTLGTLTIIFVNIPPGFLCHRRHYRHYTRALTPSDTLHAHTQMRPNMNLADTEQDACACDICDMEGVGFFFCLQL